APRARVDPAGLSPGGPLPLPWAPVVRARGRLPEEAVYRAWTAEPETLAGAGIRSVTAIGDGLAPATIAHAVYAGHRYARELDADYTPDTPFKRELAIGA